MAAYLDALADVPPLWVRRALYVLVMEDAGRRFVPSISQIRGTAADEIRKQWQKHNNRPGGQSHGPTKVDIGRWLSVAKGEARAPSTIHLREPVPAPETERPKVISIDDYRPPKEKDPGEELGF